MDKKIPMLRFPPFADAWEMKRLGDYTLSSAFGPRFSSNLYAADGNVLTLRTTDMNDDGVIDYKNAPKANLNLEQLKEHVLSVNDLVISRSGTIGITGLFEGHNIPVIPGAFLIRFRFNQHKILPKFIQFSFNSPKGRDKMESLSAGGVQKNLTGTSLLNMDICFPSLPEQTKIAAYFAAIDAKIDQLKTKKRLLEQYKKGVMQQIFAQQLRFKAVDGADFPEWAVKPLGEISKITTGSSNREDSNLDGEFTFFDRSQDIRSSNHFLFDAEAVIVPGEGQEFIPKYFIGKFDLHQRTYAIMDFKNHSGKFLYYSISYNSKHLNVQAVGTTVKSLRLPMFTNMPIALPCLAEQTKIANFLSAIDDKIHVCTRQLAQTTAYKKGILQQTFI